MHLSNFTFSCKIEKDLIKAYRYFTLRKLICCNLGENCSSRFNRGYSLFIQITFI